MKLNLGTTTFTDKRDQSRDDVKYHVVAQYLPDPPVLTDSQDPQNSRIGARSGLVEPECRSNAPLVTPLAIRLVKTEPIWERAASLRSQLQECADPVDLEISKILAKNPAAAGTDEIPVRVVYRIHIGIPALSVI